MRDGCRRLPTAREWPAEFGPYTPGYQPRSGKHRDSTQADKGPKPLPKPSEEKETRIATKRRTSVPKRRSISAIRDFSPILGRFNLYLSNEQKRNAYSTDSDFEQVHPVGTRGNSTAKDGSITRRIQPSEDCISLQHRQGL
jgi:hypothetical protein